MNNYLMNSNDIINLIINRRSHRQYINKDISDDIIKKLIFCGMNAPFGGKPIIDCQTTEYIVIKSKEIKEKLALNFEDRQFIKNAPVILAILANKNKDPKYKEYIISSSLSIENIIIASESLGIGTCVLSCFLNHKNHILDKKITRNILNLPDNIELIALLALGYKDIKESIDKKDLSAYKKAVHFEQYNN